MSTHESSCVVCGKSTYCTQDEHALGCGDGGCYGSDHKIEFCSEECFRKLHGRMKERWPIYCEVIGRDDVESL